MHLGLDAAPAVVSAPPFPDGSTEIARGIDRIVAGDSPCARGFPRFGILAGCYDGMGIAGGNRVVAFARVVAPVCRDAADGLILWNLVEQLRQHGRIAHIACGDLHGPLNLLIDSTGIKSEGEGEVVQDFRPVCRRAKLWHWFHIRRQPSGSGIVYHRPRLSTAE